MQPNPHPAARKAPDEGLIAILMTMLRALIVGDLRQLVLPGAAALPLWNRLAAAYPDRHPPAAEPALRQPARLECVLIAPRRRKHPNRRPAFGRTPYRRNATPRHTLFIQPPAAQHPRPQPKSQPPPAVARAGTSPQRAAVPRL